MALPASTANNASRKLRTIRLLANSAAPSLHPITHTNGKIVIRNVTTMLPEEVSIESDFSVNRHAISPRQQRNRGASAANIPSDAGTINSSSVRQGDWSACCRNSRRQGNSDSGRSAALSAFSLRGSAESAVGRRAKARRNGDSDRRGTEFWPLSHTPHAHFSADGRAGARSTEVHLVQRHLSARPLSSRTNGRSLRQGRAGQRLIAAN